MKKGLDESVSHMDDGDSKAKSSKETPHIFQVWKLPFKPIKSTIGDKIVRTPAPSPPFKVGVFVVFYG